MEVQIGAKRNAGSNRTKADTSEGATNPMGASRIFYRVTDGQPVEVRPPSIVHIEGAKINATAAIAQNAVVVWSQDDRPESDDWGDLAGVQFEMELRDPANEAQLRLFADYR